MFSTINDVLQAVKSNQLKSPVTKESPCNLMVMEGLVNEGYIKADIHVPLADGKPQFFNPELTLKGELKLKELATPVTLWSIDRRLAVLAVVASLLGILVTIMLESPVGT
ncbi:hypothetical protein [Shewanella xiamenensis]|uniref:hypothetical protein n=1 Tax=Shewanella xiamenensis TaxID=332186 RepID=UPI0024A6B89C|nr:hypothetical protein [Shewanella xiamenensis]MDI5837063.1 hypothetical protein [Shewanella xiamenensis]MDI5868626.1 hypothetical protein [Shewanella xiamenensis]